MPGFHVGEAGTVADCILELWGLARCLCDHGIAAGAAPDVGGDLGGGIRSSMSRAGRGRLAGNVGQYDYNLVTCEYDCSTSAIGAWQKYNTMVTKY